ncbi:carotenoid biosynthesis protein [Paenibacillus sp. 19GGS1-52]|uniref:carotenoid biosynthesis protein n=1 Tax=Paenibacillus sp. 19GGS1-52 TaxID=2758563 RepID=UPI001EFA82E2|nr:carotenoid biosynthesis protein [Paenibacillus sp. 19GGS1-52]ULO07891.1 carotenoid biosynthesis protein [Paenibacillus sp. 19GGS1-52]
MIRYLFWAWYFIGALLLIVFSIPESLQFSNGLFLIFYAAYALDLTNKGIEQPFLSDQSVSSWRGLPSWLSAIVIWSGGMGVEWIGVHSGRLFGSYEYSNILGPLLFGVPVTLGFAWIAVVCGAVLISNDFGLTGVRLSLVRALQTGFWSVLLDLVLDPVAHAKGFWHWGSSGGLYGVPWSNFLGWFIVSAALSLSLQVFKISRLSVRRGTRLYQAILIMFGLMAVREGLMLCAGIAGLGVLLAEGSLYYAGSRQIKKL